MTRRRRRNKRLRRQAAPVPEAYRASLRDRKSRSGDDAAPEDMDAFRLAIVRKINTVLGTPRCCRESVCRRSRRCMGPDLRCQRDRPPEPVSEEQAALNLFRIRQALERELARREAVAAKAAVSAPLQASCTASPDRPSRRHGARS